jgi:glycosyltransferase involved in cell wall biosynthesis
MGRDEGIMPRFSVVIPVYNRGRLVKEAIDSVLSQTNKDFEVIVVDDGSTDDTMKVLESYGNRIMILSQSNEGPEVARNTGANMASGDYVAFLDSDDLMLPWALQTYERIIVSQDHPALILSHLAYFNEANPLTVEDLAAEQIEIVPYKNCISKDRTVRASASIIVVKQDVFSRAGGFRQSSATTFFCDDIDFMLRVGCAGPAILIESPPVVAYRVHQSNVVHDVEFGFRGIMSIIQAEKAGAYPGGPLHRLRRYAFIGGPAYFWCKKTLRHGFPVLSIRILISGFFMLLAGIIRQVWLKMHGTIQKDTLETKTNSPQSSP